MAKDWARGFYNSPAWKKQRLYILKRDNYTCTEPGCIGVGTEVHHIIELTKENINDVNISLNENNLRTLCHDCHSRITKLMKSNCENILQDIIFDEFGFPINVDGVEKKTAPRC